MVNTIALVILLMCYSCDMYERHNYDYPKVVYFSSKGGEQKINGGQPMLNVSIMSGIDSYVDRYERIDSVTSSICYKWLTAEYNYTKPYVLLKAEPNDNKQRREFTIECSFGTDYAQIRIIQEGKRK